MMAILLAGLSGFLKGMHSRSPIRARGFGDVVSSAATEELAYRAAPAALAAAFGQQLPVGATAAVFAADHVLSETHTVASGAMRFADVFMGGLLYEEAFTKYGLLGAIASHSLHNLGVYLGASSRKPKRRTSFGHCR